MARLAGKVAIITGAASGLGAASARRFVEEGASVVITDLDDGAGQALADELGQNCAYLHDDHMDRAQNEAAVALAAERWGGLDILFNNAGTPFSGTFEGIDDAALDRVVDVNLKGPFRMTQAALPELRKRAQASENGAVILFTSSLQALMARPNFTPYTAAKHGVHGLTRGLALELAPENIRVNTLCPAATDTPMLKEFLPGMADDWEEAKARFRSTIPLGRMPEEVDTANAAVFLASDEARMITGIALPIDGGTTAA
ncbi:MAG TPA: glucose 1-dehydrogenase [Alphaproteobacteria bacterium]|jgi:3-oxoacyl-[acyl-carrier protein] reductase|nr:glucose 1-dehydrogenase [Alphaproteobacteria bacterium]MDP6271877.1 glucose 1-dehydrogenase [Alphaproteobacteria bacterium]MDP7426958.1 glucose 1-dehydrogenase [Alphaproteobacteria bacterium]HJM48242.1 glucose 1-dehydrogenase [Alphaproteobacteria bacterium]